VLLKLEEGADMDATEVELLSRVVDELKPETEPVADQPVGDLAMLALKKKKLEILEKF